MSSLSMIDEMLIYLGSTSTSTKQANEGVMTSNATTFGGDYETKSTEQHDVQLTLRGIPEYENYPYKQSADTFLFMADIKAPLFKRTIDRASIDLVCVIDDSGSMSGDRIKLVLQTVEFIIKNLEHNDRFGIITFSNDSKEILKLTKMDQNGQEMALNECRKITANGGTALCNGLMDGIKMLRNRSASDPNNNKIASVMLFTDGKANRGITNKVKILNEMDKYMMDDYDKDKDKDDTMGNDDDEKQIEGAEDGDMFSCSINTFGFGKDHNESLLEEIGERGNGMYSFIETEDLIAETFAEALGGLISVCGQNLFVTINALNGVAINKCLSKRFKKKEITKNKIMQIKIPDIQSEEERSLLFELTLPSQNMVKKDCGIIGFSVEYNNTISNKKEVLNTVCSINRIDGDVKDIGERNLELDEQNNRIVAADAMEKANNFAENNQLDEARKIIKNAQQIIKTSRSKNESYSVTLVHDLEQCLSKLVSQYEYRSSGRQYMTMNCSSHYHQRSTQSYNISNVSQARYRTSARCAMVRNFTPSSNPDKDKDKNQTK